jgi:ribose transport system substrate-binding protein
MLKKICLMLTVGLLCFSLVACSKAETSAPAPAPAENTGAADDEALKGPNNGTKYVIGVSLPSPDNQWVAAVIDNANTQAKMDGEKYEFMITTANNPAKQVSDIEDMLIKKPDAMVIFPIESAPLTPIAEQVKKNGIPLLVLTRGIESENYDAYIRGDDRAVGIAAAHYIGERLDGEGNIVMMQAAPCAITTERTDGFNETIAKYYPGIKVIATGNGNFAREPAMKEMENILQAQDKIDAVYSQDDEQALGCIAAIKAAGRENEMFVTGVGGNKSVLELLKNQDSLMAATFFYSPLQGGSAVKLAEKMAQGLGMSDLWEKSVPREIIFSADTITSENAEQYYNPDSQY